MKFHQKSPDIIRQELQMKTKQAVDNLMNKSANPSATQKDFFRKEAAPPNELKHEDSMLLVNHFNDLSMLESNKKAIKLSKKQSRANTSSRQGSSVLDLHPNETLYGLSKHMSRNVRRLTGYNTNILRKDLTGSKFFNDYCNSGGTTHKNSLQ